MELINKPMKGLLYIATFVMLFSCNKNETSRPVDLVYPQMGSAWSRWFYFSSACRPFGMVSLFPDTKIDGEWKSGYRYGVDTIRDFSHIHEWQLSGVAVMPVTFTDENRDSIFADWSSVFSHQTETVKPGYHSVLLERYQIKAELTATNRVGAHRYKFPENTKNGVVFQLSKQLGPAELIEGGFKQTTENEITGFMVNSPTMRRPKPTTVYFCARFSQPIKLIHLSTAHGISPSTEWKGENGNILVEFNENLDEPLLMKVAVSFTDEAGAAKNLETEMPGWDFNQVAQEADNHWNDMLSRIEIEGGTEQQQRRFYSDLYHAIMGRRIISDADGKYADLTGPEKIIRQLPLNEQGKPKFNMYNSDAFWGAQWTLNTLWQLVYPEVAQEFCNSFLEYYKNGGLIPRGPSGGNYTFVMTGASSTPFFVSTWQKGIRGFDINLAYAGLKKNHLPGGMMSKVGYEHSTTNGGGLEWYIQNGYVPYPLSDTIYGSHQDGAAITLENSYQDWCLAQLAKLLGKMDDYNTFIQQSDNFKNLFNPELGFMIPKDKSGNWKTPFDPLLYDNGFIEGNGAQYTWFVPHNLPALFELLGGADSAISRLNREFELTREFGFCNEHPEKEAFTGLKYVNDRRTWINYSNQPNSHAAFIFNHAGAPWLTQYWSRTVVDSVFSGLSPYLGYQGDEDQGLMGSLAVLMKMGIFQMSGGCGEDPLYELGSPLFDKVTIHLQSEFYQSPAFTITCNGNNSNSPFIQQATLNGQPLKTVWFKHSDINKGALISLKMGSKPNTTCFNK
ncbi:MAG TPA: glycoside hydrolase family 92 protein [Marinilabiliales bacterium]|nr:glycoside hydrolase family 92 protein [Marinilabiliales bacterium]